MSDQRKQKLKQQTKQNYRNNQMKNILVPQGMAGSAPILPSRPLVKGRKRQFEVQGGKGKRKKAKIIESVPKKKKKKRKKKNLNYFYSLFCIVW